NLSKTRLFWGSFRKRCRPESCSPFLGPARPRPEPPDKVTWLEARRVLLLLYIERKREAGKRAGKSLRGVQIPRLLCLWTSAMGIIKLTDNWPALAFGSTL